MDCRCPGILILWPNEFSFFLSWSVKTQLNFFEEFWVVENQAKSRALGSKRHPHSFFLSQLLWHRSPSIFFCFLGGEYSTSVSLTLPHSGLRVFTLYILQETARQSVCAPGAGFNSLQFCRLVAYHNKWESRGRHLWQSGGRDMESRYSWRQEICREGPTDLDEETTPRRSKPHSHVYEGVFTTVVSNK